MENSLIQISVDVERNLTRYYDDIKWDIIDVLRDLEYPGESNLIDSQAFVVHTEYGDCFFVADFLFESRTDIIVIGIKDITLDSFLDYINLDKYIRYGV